jgi:hypothetical protein
MSLLAPEDFLAALEPWESRIRHMYLDSARTNGVPSPNVTIGIGCLLANVQAATALPFQISSGGLGGEPQRAATVDEIRADWDRVRAMAPGFLAAHYQGHATLLFLLDDAIDELALWRLENDCLPVLHRYFPRFDDLPQGVQLAIVDMAWNLGLGGLHKFGEFIGAVNRDDFDTAARECHRIDCRPERNDWCRRELLGAAATA